MLGLMIKVAVHLFVVWPLKLFVVLPLKLFGWCMGALGSLTGWLVWLCVLPFKLLVLPIKLLLLPVKLILLPFKVLVSWVW